MQDCNFTLYSIKLDYSSACLAENEGENYSEKTV